MRENEKIREYKQSFYQNNRISFLTAAALSILLTAFNLVISWLLGTILDCISGGDMKELNACLRIIVILIFAYLLLDGLHQFSKSCFIHRALMQYKSFAFGRLSQKGISAFFRENTGRYLSVLTNDVNSIEENYLNRTLMILHHSASFAGALAMMFFSSWLLTLSAILLCGLPAIVSLTMGRELSERERRVSDLNEGFVGTVKDLLAGFSVIKSFKAEEQAAALFDRFNRKAEEAKRRRRFWEGWMNTLSNCCGMIFQFTIFLLGAWLAIRGQITAGTVLIFVNLCNYLLMPIQTIPQYWASRRAALGLMEKLSEINDMSTRREGKTICPVLKRAIELKHVSFGYEAEKEVLHDVCVTLEAGKKYAVVGASGSGKSTFLNLLMGAYPNYEGSILLDGMQLRDVDTDSLYELFSLVGQNVFLFDDTIENNITMFRKFPEQEVKDAVIRSGLTKLIGEKGMDYRCMENGAGLSGGERQRISIARCLLRSTPILMMDEACAALDNQTAYEITDSMLHLDGITGIVVTHRLERALMEQYDGILVFRGGVLKEQGSFRELMEQKGYFYSMFTLEQ